MNHRVQQVFESFGAGSILVCVETCLFSVGHFLTFSLGDALYFV